MLTLTTLLLALITSEPFRQPITNYSYYIWGAFTKQPPGSCGSFEKLSARVNYAVTQRPGLTNFLRHGQNYPFQPIGNFRLPLHVVCTKQLELKQVFHQSHRKKTSHKKIQTAYLRRDEKFDKCVRSMSRFLCRRRTFSVSRNRKGF